MQNSQHAKFNFIYLFSFHFAAPKPRNIRQLFGIFRDFFFFFLSHERSLAGDILYTTQWAILPVPIVMALSIYAKYM